jgi:hypothetical protein
MEYHKIQSLYKRDPKTKNKSFLEGEFACPEFEFLKECQWVGTEKIDGTNIRLYKQTGRIGGRTDNAQIHAGLIEHLKEVQETLANSQIPEDTILYGEGYGSKIQSGGQYIPDGQSFVLFDVIICGNYQPRSSVEDIAHKLKIPCVPILGTQTLEQWVNFIKAGGKDSTLHPGAKNEGVVLRPQTELRTRCGERVITKLKFKDFGL